MKVSKKVTAEHKEQIIAAAAKHYRERGFDGVSVADLMKEVSLTHGGFYRHFSSKDDLIALSALRAVSETITEWRRIADDAPGDRLEAVIHYYLSLRHHDHPETGCLAAALGCELSRLPTPVKDAVTDGERQIIDFLSGIAPSKTKALRRKQAIVAFASMVGGITLARMTSDGELRQEIMKNVAHAASNSVSATVLTLLHHLTLCNPRYPMVLGQCTLGSPRRYLANLRHHPLLCHRRLHIIRQQSGCASNRTGRRVTLDTHRNSGE